jgi:hypothetical protein
MAATYMQLNHFELASQIMQHSFKYSDKVSQVYFRYAQSLLFNKGCSLEQAIKAK